MRSLFFSTCRFHPPRIQIDFACQCTRRLRQSEVWRASYSCHWNWEEGNVLPGWCNRFSALQMPFLRVRMMILDKLTQSSSIWRMKFYRFERTIATKQTVNREALRPQETSFLCWYLICSGLVVGYDKAHVHLSSSSLSRSVQFFLSAAETIMSSQYADTTAYVWIDRHATTLLIVWQNASRTQSENGDQRKT